MTASSNATADDTPAVKAWFKLVPETGSLLVLPMCQAENETMIRYEISATKVGPSGRSKSSQGGQKLLPSQQEVSLSSLQFGLSPEDSYEFEMRIFVSNINVSTVNKEYP